MPDTNMPNRGRQPQALTARQLEILELLANGLSSPDIAAQLGITPGTVKAHLNMIYRKIGVTNRVEATRYYLHDRSRRQVQ